MDGMRSLHASTAPDLTAAANLMSDATSGFVQPNYAREALDALIAAGWELIPPDRDPDEIVLARLAEMRPEGRLAMVGHGAGAYQWADAGHLLRYLLRGATS